MVRWLVLIPYRDTYPSSATVSGGCDGGRGEGREGMMLYIGEVVGGD